MADQRQASAQFEMSDSSEVQLRKQGRRRGPLLRALAPIALAVLIVAAGLWLYSAPKHQGFQLALWRSASLERGERLAMVEEVLQNHLEIGMTGEDVRERLGHEDWRFRTGDGFVVGYRLGYIKRFQCQLFSTPRTLGFADDGSWLELHMNREGRLASALWGSHKVPVIRSLAGSDAAE